MLKNIWTSVAANGAANRAGLTESTRKISHVMEGFIGDRLGHIAGCGFLVPNYYDPCIVILHR
jgi:hypothetical protein